VKIYKRIIQAIVLMTALLTMYFIP